MSIVETLGGEERPIVANIFPIDSTTVNAVFEMIGDQDLRELVSQEEELLRIENPDALQYLTYLRDKWPDETGETGFQIGISLAYKIFSQKAYPGRIPRLSEEFVAGHDRQVVDHSRKAYAGLLKAYIEGKKKEHYVRLGLFGLLEKEFYASLTEKFSTQGSKTTMWENSIFIGLVYAYFLFREGLEDPKNYH